MDMSQFSGSGSSEFHTKAIGPYQLSVQNGHTAESTTGAVEVF